MGEGGLSVRPVRSGYVWLSVAALLAAALIAGWLWADKEEGPAKIVVIIKATEEIDFWRVLADGVNAASREFGVDTEVVGPPREVEVDLQIELLEQAVKQKPDAIILAAGDYNRLVPHVEKVRDAGIPLIFVDSFAEGNEVASLIATNNMEAGKQAGRQMAGILPEEANVAIVSFVEGVSTQIEREQGVRSILENRPETHITGTYYSGGEEDVAYEVTKKLLQEQPELDGIVGLNEPSTVGAGRAIKELGMQGRVKLVGFDSSIAEVRLLEEGVLHSTVVQKPFSMGYLGVKTALSVINGERVEKYMDTGSVIIHKDNMYTEENQQLLFPFVEG